MFVKLWTLWGGVGMKMYNNFVVHAEWVPWWGEVAQSDVSLGESFKAVRRRDESAYESVKEI